jgi:sterol 3beta-glucosyltransferase
VLLFTVGSEGDVRPFAALAGRLRAEGHDPVLAAPALYRPLAAAGVAFEPLDLDMTEVGGAVAGRHGLRHLLTFAKAMGQRAAGALPGATAAATAHGPIDLVVHHPVVPIGQHLAELLGVPAVVAALAPTLVPTRQFPSPAWPGPIRLPALLNRGSYWPASAHITGYWFTGNEPTWSPPRRLAAFLDAGDPPVYLGFGSMPVDRPAALAGAVTMTARQTGARFIVYSLNSELTRRLAGHGNQILTVRPVPHAWLFPRTAAVVHHGGAGTAGAAVAAGRPQVIWPFGVDQHFWADRMTSLGVAVPASPVRALSGSGLAAAVAQAIGDRSVSDRARDLAARVRADDGLGQAVAHLERLGRGTTVAVGA